MTGDDSHAPPTGIWRFAPGWVPRRTQEWAPNPLGAVALFALEALIVFVLAIIGFGVAAVALWVF